ncbi:MULTISPECIES: hypothetical protein [unclassified Mammaliicoccus]|uniref:hypothetical protein n=1 Tax=unclassified Mammaliicoccus TaxID=2803851 RepID=UPI001EFB2304|nr:MULTISPECIES: hypothetical protein [unclassified Mammaliicoccus]
MDEIIEDISRSVWNFITLALSIAFYFYLKHSANTFVSLHGSGVRARNLINQEYMTDTGRILALMFLTIVLFAITIFIAFKSASFTGLFQILVSLWFIYLTFRISALPFLGTALLTIVIGGALVYIITHTN